MSNQLPSDAIEALRASEAARAAEDGSEAQGVFGAWNLLQRVLSQNVPVDMQRARRSQRRIARGR